MIHNPRFASGHMMRICSSHEMRHLDEVADKEYGLDAELLMENAGRAAAQALIDRFPNAGKTSEILVFAGKGNNAGDAFVVARRLLCFERKVRVFHLAQEEDYKGASLKYFRILKRLRAKLSFLDSVAELQAFTNSSPGPFTIVDGIFGTGLKGNLEGLFYDVIEHINELKSSEVIALDIPSGVSGDTGEILGTSVQATFTVSFGYPKLGHFLPPGAAKRGELMNVDISLPPKFHREGDKYLLMRSPMAATIKERDRYGHKNSFGHSLLVGGSRGRIGAIAMAARACHKIGTGLVTVATWEDVFDSLVEKIPTESMSVPITMESGEYKKYAEMLSTYSSVVVGPGLGLRSDGKKVLEDLLSYYQGPVVVDADALNLVADYKLHGAIRDRKGPTVLTPHPGEMARLLGISRDEVMKDPVASVRKAVSETHAIVLLKGAATLIASPEDVLYLNHYPNDGMATAGSGDVLAGMIGGLLGQKMNPFQATLLGVYLHSLAGDYAAKNFGHRSMTAGDIIDNIYNAFKDLKSQNETNLTAAQTPASPLVVEGRARLL